MIYKTPLVLALFMLIAILHGSAIDANRCSAQTIQAQLQKHIPNVINYLNERNFKTVGVLKFRVKKQGSKTSDSVGPINSLLADRIEVGLVLGNPFDESKQLNVIKDASRKLAKVEGANHLTAEGRLACFKPKFEIAWGDDELQADAFVTGVVQVHDDNEHVTIGILCFNNDGQPLEKACEVFQAELDAASLAELGDSFLVRGGIDSSVVRDLTKSLIDANRKLNPQQPNLTPKQVHHIKQKTAVKEAVRVKKQAAPFPLSDPSAPLNLEVIYDGQRVPIEVRNGHAFVPEPQEGQKIEFGLVRGNSIPGRIVVVLKVNGENTLYRQTIRDIDCAKWLLNPDRPRAVIRGYQLRDGKTMEEFKVLSREESEERAMNYGRNVGQIQLTVYREMTGQTSEPDLLDESDEDMLAMMRGTQPAKKPKNLGALKQQIRKPNAGDLATRGLIVHGQKKSNVVRKAVMKPDPTPVMAVTITYYKP